MTATRRAGHEVSRDGEARIALRDQLSVALEAAGFTISARGDDRLDVDRIIEPKFLIWAWSCRISLEEAEAGPRLRVHRQIFGAAVGLRASRRIGLALAVITLLIGAWNLIQAELVHALLCIGVAALFCLAGYYGPYIRLRAVDILAHRQSAALLVGVISSVSDLPLRVDGMF